MSHAYARLQESIRAAKSVKLLKNENTAYTFKLYPFGERGTFIEPELLSEITDSLAVSLLENFGPYDYLVSPEPGGHTWGMLAAYKVKKPMNILRLSSEKYEEFKISIKRETAYNENYIYFDGFTPGDRVLLLDDVISSGATIRAIADQLRVLGVELAGIQVILVKGEHYKRLEEDYGVPIHYLASV